MPSSGLLTSNANSTQAVPAIPVGTTSVSIQVMRGLAGSITPGAYGRVLFMASGDGFNTSAVGQASLCNFAMEPAQLQAMAQLLRAQLSVEP